MPRTKVTQAAKISAQEAAICERLRTKRRALGIQQKEAARRINVPLDTFRGYEYARSPLRYGAGKRFCSEFDVNQRWLATGELPSKPYLELSPLVDQFIPEDMLFSKVADLLLSDVIQGALEDIAEIHGDKCEISEIDNWSHVPWTPILFPSERDGHQMILHMMEESVAHTFHLIPPQLMGIFERALAEFLAEFEKKHSKSIQHFLKSFRRDPTKTLREEEQTARTLVANVLAIDPDRLRHISTLDPSSGKR